MYAVMDLRFPWNERDFLTSWEPLSCSRRTMLHVVCLLVRVDSMLSCWILKWRNAENFGFRNIGASVTACRKGVFGGLEAWITFCHLLSYKKKVVRSGIRTHALREDQNSQLPTERASMKLESGALDRSAILTCWGLCSVKFQKQQHRTHLYIFLSTYYSFRHKTAVISILVFARTLYDHSTSYSADSLFWLWK